MQYAPGSTGFRWNAWQLHRFSAVAMNMHRPVGSSGEVEREAGCEALSWSGRPLGGNSGDEGLEVMGPRSFRGLKSPRAP